MKVSIFHMRMDFPRASPLFDRAFDIHSTGQRPTLNDVSTLYKPAWTGSLALSGMGPNEQLDSLWRIVELGGSSCPIPRARGVPGAIRSFMVGDIVLLDGAAFQCADVGWVKLDDSISHALKAPGVSA